MISHKHKFIFIHIPKCAGSSIEKVFFPGSRRKNWFGYNKKIGGFLQHLTCREIIYFNFLDRQTFDAMFKFTFVRNPWDKMVSEYVWRIKRAGNFVNAPLNVRHGKSHPNGTKSNVKKTTYKDFLLGNFLWQEISYEQHMKSQVSYMHEETGKLLVDFGVVLTDFIGRFENLQEDFNIVCDKIGTPQRKLPHRNKTKHKHYTEYYDDETRQLVAEKYARDIEFFGYEFGE